MGDRTITDEQFRAVLNLRGILNRAVDDLERLAIELEGDGPEIETVIARLFEWARICQKAQGGPQEIRQAELDSEDIEIVLYTRPLSEMDPASTWLRQLDVRAEGFGLTLAELRREVLAAMSRQIVEA